MVEFYKSILCSLSAYKMNEGNQKKFKWYSETLLSVWARITLRDFSCRLALHGGSFYMERGGAIYMGLGGGGVALKFKDNTGTVLTAITQQHRYEKNRTLLVSLCLFLFC